MTNRNHKQRLRQAEKWWAGTDFRTMERVPGYRQDDFNPEDGYDDFVIACNAWWEKLLAKDKIRIYHEYHY